MPRTFILFRCWWLLSVPMTKTDFHEAPSRGNKQAGWFVEALPPGPAGFVLGEIKLG